MKRRYYPSAYVSHDVQPAGTPASGAEIYYARRAARRRLYAVALAALALLALTQWVLP